MKLQAQEIVLSDGLIQDNDISVIMAHENRSHKELVDRICVLTVNEAELPETDPAFPENLRNNIAWLRGHVGGKVAMILETTRQLPEHYAQRENIANIVGHWICLGLENVQGTVRMQIFDLLDQDGLSYALFAGSPGCL